MERGWVILTLTLIKLKKNRTKHIAFKFEGLKIVKNIILFLIYDNQTKDKFWKS